VIGPPTSDAHPDQPIAVGHRVCPQRGSPVIVGGKFDGREFPLELVEHHQRQQAGTVADVVVQRFATHTERIGDRLHGQVTRGQAARCVDDLIPTDPRWTAPCSPAHHRHPRRFFTGR
jgi:hypothetical protein